MSNKTLVILESGSKVKKVQSFLGPDYLVIACYGHVRDLPGSKMNIDVGDNFKPNYTVMADKKQIVSNIRKLYKLHKNILLATDLDREGESIAYHICELLKIKSDKRKRLIFSEITKKALTDAVKNPKNIDNNIFYAQQARRIIDRLIGYSISPILWNQIQNSYKKKISLSAGRVQSVVLKLIIDREKEIEKFNSKTFFKTIGIFTHNKKEIKATLFEDIDNNNEIEEFLADCQKSEFSVDSVKCKKLTKYASTPFITSTLQQEASTKYNMSPKSTMSTAQKLYENGYITYMRTDSVTLSEEFLSSCKEYIMDNYGEEYLNIKRYKTKNNNSQEAHEAIRPCSILMDNISHDETMSPYEIKLYKLIWNRTVASQMSPCKSEIITTKINVSEYEEPYFISNSEKILFDGYTKIYTINTQLNDEQCHYIELKLGTKLKMKEIISTEKETKPKHFRFTEASLINQLDKLEIGRPSTYASMTSIVQDRRYVEKKDVLGIPKKMEILSINSINDDIIKTIKEVNIGSEKQKLVPNEIGFIVNDFMEKEFNTIINYKFTSELEKKLDKISSGEIEWVKLVQEIYDIFNPICQAINSKNFTVRDTNKRIIGNHPNYQTEMTAYIGKYGPVVHFKDNKNTNNFSPIGNYKIDSITMEQALSLFEYPKQLNDEITVKKGKFGIYFTYKDNSYNLKNSNISPENLNVEICMDIIKQKKNTSKIIKKINDDIEIKLGPYGPYICYKNKKNYKIIKNEPKNLTEEICMKIIKNNKK